VDQLSNFFDLSTWRSTAAAPLLELATQAFVLFALVAARLWGMLSVGPLFGHPALPRTMRLLVALGLAAVLTPALLAPEAVVVRNVELLQEASLSLPEAPPGLLEFAGLTLQELALGAALGLGVAIILSGLQMAGALIDQQLGLSLSEVMNPELKTNAALAGQLLNLLSLAVFVSIGGHVQLATALMDSFAALPVGSATIGPSVVEMLGTLVQQSLLLAMRIAAPVLAILTMVALALGILGRAMPQIQSLAVGVPLRVAVGLVVLGLSLSGASELLIEALPGTMRLMHEAISEQ